MDRAQKAETVEALKSVFAGANMMVVGHYAGLTVADLTVLRGRLRKEGASLKVVKNRLVKLAIDGTPKAAAAGLFTGDVRIDQRVHARVLQRGEKAIGKDVCHDQPHRRAGADGGK